MGFDLYARDNEKVYFRASVWSWRPLLALIDEVIKQESLPIDTSKWAYNDGDGINDNPDLCNKLAEGLRNHVKHPEQFFEVEGSTPMRCDEEGRLLREDDPEWSKGRTPWYADGQEVLDFCKFLTQCNGSFKIV